MWVKCVSGNRKTLGSSDLVKAAAAAGLCWWRNQDTAGAVFFWEVGTALLSYCLVSSARLAVVSQPVLSSALCIRGLFRNEPLCMGIIWDIWASAYCSMAKVKACPLHHRLPYPIHHLRTQTAAKLTFQPPWTSSHQFGRTVFFYGAYCLLCVSIYFSRYLNLKFLLKKKKKKVKFVEGWWNKTNERLIYLSVHW